MQLEFGKGSYKKTVIGRSRESTVITTDTAVIDAKIETVMTANPITINEDSMAVEIMKLLEKRKIDDILVTTADGKFAGLVDIQDLPKFKVM